jgi:two-component system LytT family sensor kinase
MILQPLVENAVRHGVAPSPSAGLIEISAWRQAEMLRLRVRDDGPGFGVLDESRPGSQVGLRNTVLRLERLYGDGERLHMENHQDGGAVVTLTIPWHTEPLSAAPGGEGG